MSNAAAARPLTVEKPEKTILFQRWEASADERNTDLKAGAKKVKNFKGDWRYIGVGEVSDGHRTVFLTSGIRPLDAARHIFKVVQRQEMGDEELDEQQ